MIFHFGRSIYHYYISTYVKIGIVDCLQFCAVNLYMSKRQSFTTTHCSACICLNMSYDFWK